MTGKLMAHAYCAALAAFVLSLCFGHTWFLHFDGLYAGGMAVSAVGLLFVLFRTHQVVERFVVSEATKKSARQFLWSCVFFSMLSAMFGLGVAGISWFSTDFLRKFGFVFWGAMTLVAIYPVRRDAKRVANAGQSASK
jgi:hypothetical protein